MNVFQYPSSGFENLNEGNYYVWQLMRSYETTNGTYNDYSEIFIFKVQSSSEINTTISYEDDNFSLENIRLLIGDNQYNVSVHLESFIDVIAFQMHLYHDHFEYEVETVDNKDIGLWPYDDNVGNTGEKYIVDSSVYDFDDSLCLIDYDCSGNNVICECDDGPLVLSYGYVI